MRTITTIVTVYPYDELSDEAKLAAVRNVSEKLNGPWWDSHDNERLAETMVWEFARGLKSPGWDRYGPGDFPGITGVELAEWDLDRGQTIKFKGTLTRDNAPALPWTRDIESVTLNHPDLSAAVVVDPDLTAPGELPGEAEQAMCTAVKAAVRVAWRAGRTENDYMESDEYARDWIEVDEPEFTVDGQLYR